MKNLLLRGQAGGENGNIGSRYFTKWSERYMSHPDHALAAWSGANMIQQAIWLREANFKCQIARTLLVTV